MIDTLTEKRSTYWEEEPYYKGKVSLERFFTIYLPCIFIIHDILSLKFKVTCLDFNLGIPE